MERNRNVLLCLNGKNSLKTSMQKVLFEGFFLLPNFRAKFSWSRRGRRGEGVSGGLILY